MWFVYRSLYLPETIVVSVVSAEPYTRSVRNGGDRTPATFGDV